MCASICHQLISWLDFKLALCFLVNWINLKQWLFRVQRALSFNTDKYFWSITTRLVVFASVFCLVTRINLRRTGRVFTSSSDQMTKYYLAYKHYSLDVHSCCLNHYSVVCFPYNAGLATVVRCISVRNQIAGHDCFTKPYSPVSNSAIIFIQFNTFVSFDMPKTEFTSAKLSMENP